MKTEKEFRPTLAELGQRIYRLRVLKNFVTKEIASKLHLSTVAYRNIEKGYCDISFTRLLHLAEILEVDITELVNNFNNTTSITDIKVINIFEEKERKKFVAPSM